MTTDNDVLMTDPRTSEPRIPLGILLVLGGSLGLWASYSLTQDALTLLTHAHAHLGCTVNSVVQCGKNILSWQGRFLGFPNSLLGLMMFPAPIIVGMGLLGKVRFPAWFWVLFNAGLWFAIIFVAWSSSESIYAVGTLCPWYVLVYAVVIPMWLAVTFKNLSAGRAGTLLAETGTALLPWVSLISLYLYVVLVLEAQLRLHIINSLL